MCISTQSRINGYLKSAFDVINMAFCNENEINPKKKKKSILLEFYFGLVKIHRKIDRKVLCDFGCGVG